MLEFVAHRRLYKRSGLVRINGDYYFVETGLIEEGQNRLWMRRLRLEANREFEFEDDDLVEWRIEVGQRVTAFMGFEDRLYAAYANGDLYSYQMDGTSQYLRGGFSGPFAIIRRDPCVIGGPDQETVFNIRTGEMVTDKYYADYGGQFSPFFPISKTELGGGYTINRNKVVLPNAIRQLLIYDDDIAIATTAEYAVVLRSVDDGRDAFRDTVNALIRIYDVDRTPALERALAECQAMRRRDADALARADRELAEAVARCDAELAERDARLAVAGAAAEECTICMRRPRTHTYGPCGHVFCADCVARMPDGCPQCRGRRDPRALFYP